MSKKSTFGGLVFSTDPNFKIETNDDAADTLPVEKQVLRIWLDRVKGGKEATIIKGYIGSDDDLADLAKTLKSKCATGGNAKEGNIILQGDHRDKVLKLLTDLGYKNVKKAGG